MVEQSGWLGFIGLRTFLYLKYEWILLYGKGMSITLPYKKRYSYFYMIKKILKLRVFEPI